MFVGGAVTVGPGQIVGEKKAETLRSHLDIQKGNPNTKYISKSTKFFEGLAEKASHLSTVLDLFSKRLTQIVSLLVGPSRTFGDEEFSGNDRRQYCHVG